MAKRGYASITSGEPTIMTLVLAGERSVDGILVSQPPRDEEEAA